MRPPLPPSIRRRSPARARRRCPPGSSPSSPRWSRRSRTAGEWIHEIKFDGYRVLCEIRDGKAALLTRNGKDWTDRFGPVAREAAELPVREAILDGEVVVLEPNGTTSFQALQNALSENRQDDLVFFAFDLLYLDGYDLRKAALTRPQGGLDPPSRRTAGGPPPGRPRGGRRRSLLRQACKFGLEGIISKRADQPYRSGRNKDWLKVKCLKRQEFVIVGFTDPEKSRVGFGALLLAVNQGKDLVFAGKVGTGFNDKTLRELRKRLEKMETTKPAFKNAPRGAEARRSHWVRPELVGEVAFTEWTRDGILRHPTFQGLREDKSPEEIVREEPQAAPPEAEAVPVKKSAAKKAAAPKAGPKPPIRPAPEQAPVTRQTGSKKASEIEGVRFTSLDRVLYPEQGLTKLDLAVYYSRVAEWILPHLKDRPLTLVRCPAGRSQQCFFQKHVNDTVPAAIHRVDVGDDEPYGTLSDLKGLLTLVQMGVLEIHIWGAHKDKIEQPDYVVFDLDPDEGLDWQRVVEGALLVRDFLGELGLTTFLKTTGGKGLHVVFPLTRRDDWDEVKEFTKAVAEVIVAADPDRYTSKIPKASRKGRDLHRLPEKRPGRDLHQRLLHPRPAGCARLRPPVLGRAGNGRARQHLHDPQHLRAPRKPPFRSLGGLPQDPPVDHRRDEKGRRDEVGTVLAQPGVDPMRGPR